MQPTRKPFLLSESADRLDAILNASDSSFPNEDEIPRRDALTFKNGFYVRTAVLMIDIRDSSSILKTHNRPTIARIYRAYTSEMVALINSSPACKDINIEGDGVLGVFEGSKQSYVNEVFAIAAQANTLIKLLNCKLNKKGYQRVKIGLGLAFDRTLMIKAGLKGVGVNEITWIGGAVSDAAHLCENANRLFTPPMLVGRQFYSNLNDHNKTLCSDSLEGDFYESDAIVEPMDTDYQNYC